MFQSFPALRKPQCAGALAYFLQGISVNLPLLFASKVPSLLQHCMIGAQAAVTILALPTSRALAMGRLSLRYFYHQGVLSYTVNEDLEH